MNKVPDSINQVLLQFRIRGVKGSSANYTLKAHKALRRFYLCGDKNRARSHYNDYLRFNAKSFLMKRCSNTDYDLIE